MIFKFNENVETHAQVFELASKEKVFLLKS
jgi:hypothetical protein